MIRATEAIESLATAIPETSDGSVDDRPLPPVDSWNPPYCGEIDMRIARDGTWYYRGTPIRRPRLVRLFSTILRKDGERYCLVTPVERVGIEVEDAPFLAVEMAVTAQDTQQVLWFSTNVGDKVRVGSSHPLRFETGEAGGIKPYVLVRGDLWALVARACLLDLVELGTTREHQGRPWFGVVSAGIFFPMAPADEAEADETNAGASR